jgi:hypothetical protein
MGDLISELRKYRFRLDNGTNIFNSDNDGIALFDLTTSFLGAYLLDHFFHISTYLSRFTVHYPILLYYLLVIPCGILIHILFSKNTFLNSQVMSKDFNIYKTILLIIIIIIAGLIIN